MACNRGLGCYECVNGMWHVIEGLDGKIIVVEPLEVKNEINCIDCIGVKVSIHPVYVEK